LEVALGPLRERTERFNLVNTHQMWQRSDASGCERLAPAVLGVSTGAAEKSASAVIPTA
jgi:hypothetical protein